MPQCDRCGAALDLTRYNKRFCSDSCRRQHRLAEMRRQTRDARRLRQRRCTECGETIGPERQITAMTCSDACSTERKIRGKREEDARRLKRAPYGLSEAAVGYMTGRIG